MNTQKLNLFNIKLNYWWYSFLLKWFQRFWLSALKKIYNLFINFSKTDLSWFIYDYLGKRQSIDLKIKKTGENNFIVSEKNNIEIPYAVGLLKNDSIVYSKIYSKSGKINLPEISMGMTNDYLDALEYKSTYLRIGTGIFGKRAK